MNNELESYRVIVEARKVVKKVSQISWNLDRFDKRFPIETLQDGEETEYLKAVLGFFRDIAPLSKEINEFLKREKDVLIGLGIDESEIDEIIT